MSEELESRLRRDLSTLDAVPVGDEAAVESAWRSSTVRRGRRRPRALVAMSLSLVVAGAAGVWLVQRDREQVASTDSVVPTAPDSTPSSIIPSTSIAPAEGDAVLSGWRPIAADPRGAVLRSSVVWTGKYAVAFDGLDRDGAPVAGAALYDPVSDAWLSAADPPAGVGAAGRVNGLAVWTGGEALVLGGDLPDGELLVSYGLAYDPVNDSWRVTASPPGFVSARSPSVWTGDELLVWPSDGNGSTMDVTPVAYDPATDAWRELARPPIQRRQQAASAWTGSEWIVWGGTDNGVEFNDGAAYNPTTDTWRLLSEAPLSPRRVRGVWTGSEMILAAGSSGGDPATGNGEFAHDDGAAYDPSTDTWRTISPGPAHPGFEPIWTGDQVLMFAKGGVAAYHPTTDDWTDDCCAPSAISSAPVWTGNEAILMGSTDPSIGGATYTPSRATGIDPAPTVDAATTTTPVAAVDDELADALAALGVDLERAPADATQLGDATLCGVEQKGQGTPADWNLDEAARRCFIDRHMSAQPAVFVEQAPTTEGDPIVTVWRTLDDGTVTVAIDSTRDSFGSGAWESQTCGRLTTRFPDAPEPLPASYFACDASSIDAVGRVDTPSAQMPAWFSDRPPLPLCGYEIRIDDGDTTWRQCFSDAVARGAPAEYAHISTGDEGERSTRWFRSLGDGTYEVLEWRSGLIVNGNVWDESGWHRYDCTTIYIRDAGTLPVLNQAGECTEREPDD